MILKIKLIEIGPSTDVNPTILFKIPCNKPWSFSEVSFDMKAFRVGFTISDKAAMGIIRNTSASTRTKPNPTSAMHPHVKEKSVKDFVDNWSKND